MIRRTASIAQKAARTRGVQISRQFHLNAVRKAASLMEMPAMSPTMEEGGIVSWKVKPGQTFSAGDELLEIETDKAQISVEAPDDGILVKIFEEDGAKEVPVGKPIAVLAEEGDEVSSADIDALLAKKKPQGSAPPEAPAKKETAAPTPASHEKPDSKPASEPASASGTGTATLLPSVIRLVHENNISQSQLDQIKGSGPSGRITKGDVLAFLGKISKSAPEAEEQRLEKLSHLDLSNVEVAAKKDGPAEPAKPVKEPSILTLTEKIAIPPDTTPLEIARSKRLALRDTLSALQPKPSALHDPTFDLLVAEKPVFSVEVGPIEIVRAKPVAVPVAVTYAKSTADAAKLFVAKLRTYLAE